jgi:hypothetical protein
VREPTHVEPVVAFRALGRHEVSRVAEIDRHERIEVLYEQHGTQLVERHGHWEAPGWDPEGTGEHSVAAKVREAEQYVDGGGVVVGAFADDRLVGIGITCASHSDRNSYDSTAQLSLNAGRMSGHTSSPSVTAPRTPVCPPHASNSNRSE